jgi:hypothetical protein
MANLARSPHVGQKNSHHLRYTNHLNIIFVVLLTVPELAGNKLKSVICVSGTIYSPLSLKLMLPSL